MFTTDPTISQNHPIVYTSYIRCKAAFWGYLPNDFSRIPNYFSNKGYQYAKELLNTQLNMFVLHRKYRRRVLLHIWNLPILNQNLQIPNKFYIKGKYPIPKKSISVSLYRQIVSLDPFILNCARIAKNQIIKLQIHLITNSVYQKSKQWL